MVTLGRATLCGSMLLVMFYSFTWVVKIRVLYFLHPWSRKQQPTSVSFLGNPMDRGVWWTTVQGLQNFRHDWATEHTCTVSSYYIHIVLVFMNFKYYTYSTCIIHIYLHIYIKLINMIYVQFVFDIQILIYCCITEMYFLKQKWGWWRYKGDDGGTVPIDRDCSIMWICHSLFSSTITPRI